MAGHGESEYYSVQKFCHSSETATTVHRLSEGRTLRITRSTASRSVAYVHRQWRATQAFGATIVKVTDKDEEGGLEGERKVSGLASCYSDPRYSTGTGHRIRISVTGEVVYSVQCSVFVLR
ncbi:hypothetical protein J6590_062474 [Homalodisca vitripennis]|nr:hypothetical protein J6590_062474 [Homalodisca vitripennis]